MNIDNFLQNGKWHQIILVLIALILYSNTLQHDFVLDDNIVLKKNEFVKKGFSGVSDILGNDSFKGFFLNDKSGVSVTGGRYRPFSLVLFASVYPIFGLDPFYYHLLNILMYALLGWLIYRFLVYLLQHKFPQQARPVSFLASLLFIVHPLHAEVVNNVKSIDEILSLLFGILSIHSVLIFVDKRKLVQLFYAFLFLLISVFSKESAINFLYLTPLAVLFFRDIQWRDLIPSMIPAFLAILSYAGVRSMVIGAKIYEDVSRDVLLNPFMKVRGMSLTEADTSEKLGMIFTCLGKYLKLFLIPYPLTHDYFPQHVSLSNIASPASILSLFVVLGLLIYAIVTRKSNKILSFSILLMTLPLIFISNMVVPMGTPMAERFAFTASLGFSLLFAWLLFSILKNRTAFALYSVAGVSLLFGGIIFLRNKDWKNEYSLFSKDVQISKNSIKAHSELAYHLVEKIKQAPDSLTNRALIAEAIPHLEKAVQLYPRFANCVYLLGNLHYLKKDYEKAAITYNKYLDLNPNGSDVLKNLQVCYREYGREIALRESVEEIDKAIEALIKALKINPNDSKLLETMGMAYAVKKDFNLAIDYFNKAIKMSPDNGMLLVNLGNTYYKMGDKTTGSKYIKQAYKMDINLGAKLLNMQKPTVQ
ncbi:MAG: tetratricopeptide repeat protein [Saprospiraceae bacterium]|nr:tetratricopeptide repeat protein [Saprospiraceae bacterium]